MGKYEQVCHVATILDDARVEFDQDARICLSYHPRMIDLPKVCGNCTAYVVLEKLVRQRQQLEMSMAAA